MFSALQKQKKAEELIEEARKITKEADEKSSLEKKRLEESVAKTDDLHNTLSKTTLENFNTLFFEIKGVDPVEMADITERPYAAQLQRLSERLEAIEPIEIKDVNKGKFPAVIASLFAILVTIAAAFAIAIVATGTPVDIQNISSPETIKKLLTWIGGGEFGYPAASPLLGAVGIGVAAIAAALITWSLLMAKSSGRNLSEAQKSYADAKNYHDRKQFYISAMNTLHEQMNELDKILETFDVFMQEYNSIIKRILYTEGEEYEKFKEKSKETIDRAAACAEAIVPILNIAIVASDGTPSEQLFEAIAKGELYRKALIEQKPLPEKTEPLSAEEIEVEEPVEKELPETGEEEKSPSGSDTESSSTR